MNRARRTSLLLRMLAFVMMATPLRSFARLRDGDCCESRRRALRLRDGGRWLSSFLAPRWSAAYPAIYEAMPVASLNESLRSPSGVRGTIYGSATFEASN